MYVTDKIRAKIDGRVGEALCLSLSPHSGTGERNLRMRFAEAMG